MRALKAQRGTVWTLGFVWRLLLFDNHSLVFLSILGQPTVQQNKPETLRYIQLYLIVQITPCYFKQTVFVPALLSERLAYYVITLFHYMFFFAFCIITHQSKPMTVLSRIDVNKMFYWIYAVQKNLFVKHDFTTSSASSCRLTEGMIDVYFIIIVHL